MAYFHPNEFKCRCKRPDCDAPDMDRDFVALLETLRDKWGRPLILTSALRCPFWNAHIGGAEKSMHMRGKAVDIKVADLNEARALHALAESLGFGGVEISKAKLFVHVDTGPKRQWAYV